MWPTYILMALNAATWGLLLLVSPARHLSPIGSYRFWWFDDAPWLALFISIFVPALTLLMPFKSIPGVVGARLVLTTVTLIMLLPYGCMSGGGV